MKILAIFSAALLLLTSCTLNVNCFSKESGLKSGFDIKETHKSVARIFVNATKGTGQMSGTAFAIDDDYLVTAGHVCAGILEFQDAGLAQNEIWLEIVKDGVHSFKKGVEVIDYDENHDICLARRPGHDLVPLRFVDDYKKDVKFGDKVWIVGAPLAFMVSWLEGNVMDTNSKNRPPLNERLIVSAAATHGNSGSPVINEQGRVVGILVMGPNGYDHLSICVKGSQVKAFLKIAGWEEEQ